MVISRSTINVADGCGWVWRWGGFRDAKTRRLASLQPLRESWLAPDVTARAGLLAAWRRHGRPDDDGGEDPSIPVPRHGLLRHARGARIARRGAVSGSAPRRDAPACGGLPSE